jgi:hypothetical protein
MITEIIVTGNSDCRMQQEFDEASISGGDSERGHGTSRPVCCNVQGNSVASEMDNGEPWTLWL